MSKKSSSPNIFLIEDNESIIDVYSMAFKISELNFEVITLGKEALERIKKMQEGAEEKPALILLDLMLPDIGGMEILKEVRNHPATKDIVVFVLSNYTISDEQKADSAKPDKYIMKANITPTELVNLIKEQLARAGH